jgi:hypothetical protein
MEISKNLPQFDHKKAVIIVASKQAADVHLAYQGEMKTLTEIRVEKPEYSDREGHFERKSKGKNLGSGSVHEEPDKKAMQDFRNELQDFLKNLKEKVAIEQVIFMRPSQHKQQLQKKLPTYIKDAIDLEIDGNFVGDHPKKILERIDKAANS